MLKGIQINTLTVKVTDYTVEVAYYAGKRGEKNSKQQLAVLITVA